MTLLTHLSIRRLGLLAALGVMGAICYLAAAYDTFPGDADVLRRFQGFRSPWMDDAAVAATALAQPLMIYVSLPTISLALLLGGRKADALVILLVIIAEGINLGVKELVGRPRPEFSLLVTSPDSPAFPSGHAIHAFMLGALLIIILGQLIKPYWPRVAVQALLGVAILASGASRVYLGAHWPSDVIGGYLLGGLCIVALVWVRKKLINWGLQ